MSASHYPRKRFGQNFLHDPGVIGRIADAIAPRDGDSMVEIGPGQGALTCVLLPPLGRLQVVEIDRDLIPLLTEKCAGRGDLTVHVADVLRFDFRQVVAPGGSLRVCGNLPYNISTPLLFHLLGQIDVLADMHFLLQKEVVQRMAAGPGGGVYGRLSVMVQYYCRVDALFTVAPGAFWPVPQVDSALVRLVPHRSLPYPVADTSVLADLVRRAFGQRRKTLRNALKGVVSDAMLEAAGIDPNARAEVVGVAGYAALANRLCARG